MVVKYAKKAIKKLVSPMALKNIKGLKEAITSYYPVYLSGNGKINTLKHVSIEVTFRCNCRCRMCPLYGVQTNGGKDLTESMKEKEELTLDEFRKLFQGLKEVGTHSVNFTGGEAFIRKDMLDIAQYAVEAGLDVSFTSNGGLLTKEIAKKLVELGVDSLTISLDGPKEVHEDIRMAKVFDRIMSAVDWIEEEKMKKGKTVPTLDFLCTVSALNQKHLVGIVEISKKKNLSLTIDPIIFTSDEIWENSKDVLQEDFIKKESFVMPEEVGKVNTEALELEIKKVFEESKRLGHSVYISLATKDARKKFFEDPTFSVVNKCFSPWYSCRIDPYGNVYPCSLSIPMGNIREKDISKIINNKKFVNFRKKLKEKSLFPFCKKCCVLYSHNAFWNFLPKL